MPHALFKNYVTPKGEESIKSYKYKCTVDSLVYGYLMGPLANFSLKFTPISIAPNTITFIGFVFNLIPYFMMAMATGEDLSVDIPRWICVFAGFSQFLYMNFDNMDGKQARRTGSSSALGMLYDHGLDSISGWLMAMNLGAAIKLNNNMFSFLGLIGIPMLGFYFTTWEEYHLGVLNFGFINPVDEGLTVLNSLLIFTGIVGSDWWVGDGLLGLKRNECVIVGVGLVCLITIIGNIIKVYGQNKNFNLTFDKIKVVIFFVVCVVLVGFFSPSDIVNRRMRSLIMCFGLGFSKVTGHLQLAHCAGDDFPQWRRSFLVSNLVLVVNTLIGAVLGKCPIDEDIALNLAIVVNLVSLVHYFLSMTQQLTRILDIKVFSIKKAKQ